MERMPSRVQNLFIVNMVWFMAASLPSPASTNVISPAARTQMEPAISIRLALSLLAKHAMMEVAMVTKLVSLPTCNLC